MIRLIEKLERLRERPRHEREALASGLSIVAVVVLGVSWSAFFIRGLDTSGGVQVASVVNSLPQLPAPPSTNVTAAQSNNQAQSGSQSQPSVMYGPAPEATSSSLQSQ